MAKQSAQMESKAPLYALLGLIVVLLLVSIAIQLRSQDDNLTAWATIKSRELHTFFDECRGGGGSMDVRTSSSPQIVFVCDYLDRMVEYTLSPGK